MTAPDPVVRDEFVTTDPELAEDMLRQVYMDHCLSITGHRENFTFRHEAVTVTGSSALSINRIHNTMTMRFDCDALDEDLLVNAVTRGSVGVTDHPVFDDLIAGPGEVFLCPTGQFKTFAEPADVVPPVLSHDQVAAHAAVPTLLSHDQVAAHAAARTGIEPGSLRFTGLRPISGTAGSLWIQTVAHVRDDLLAVPELTAEPLILDSAYRLLATTVIATFPNTALDAVNDPLSCGPGHVAADTASRAVDYVRDHAGEPITPGDVATQIGAPTGDINAALRRRRNTSLALQLWAARMQGAYRDLHAADPAAGDTVAAISARWGFGNPGRFAVEYRQVYGCSPSETLRR